MSDTKSSSEKKRKPPVFQGCLNYFPRALVEVAKVSQYGTAKHGAELSEKGFLRPQYTLAMYEDAMARHTLALATEGEINEADGGLLHRAQRAWNALASLEKYLVQQEQNGTMIVYHKEEKRKDEKLFTTDGWHDQCPHCLGWYHRGTAHDCGGG